MVAMRKRRIFEKNVVKQLCHVLSHSCIHFGLISFVFGMVDLSVSQELDFRDFHRPSEYNVDEETQVRSYLRVISEVTISCTLGCNPCTSVYTCSGIHV